MVLVAGVAAWATRARILSGIGLGFTGSAMQAALWAIVYVGLGGIYRGAAPHDATFEHRVLRRLGCALILAFVSAVIIKWSMEPLLAPLTWNEFRYLRLVLGPVCVAVWCAALLPRATYQLCRIAETRSAVAPFPQLALLLAAAAVLVSCCDWRFEFSNWPEADSGLKAAVIADRAWATNTLVLFSAFALVFAASARVGIALLAVGPVYAVWAAANLVKLGYMHVPVQPLDVILIPELWPLLAKFFGRGILAAIVVAFLIGWACSLSSAA